MDRLPAKHERIHFVGIGGAGNSALARVLCQWGYAVSGSDEQPSPLTAALALEGIEVSAGHAAAHVAGAGLVVRSSAVSIDNIELLAAREAGIPVVKRAELLGLLADRRVSIAVAGTHGKSTTSAMIAKVCHDAGTDPSFIIGAVARDFGTNARAGAGETIVVEADEYDRSFLHLRPRVAVVTNVEADHPDVYPTLAEIDEAFGRFIAGVESGGGLVLCGDDPGCRRLIARLPEEQVHGLVTYGQAPCNCWCLADDGAIRGPHGAVGARLRLLVPGPHNRLNALAAVAATSLVGIAPEVAVGSLNGFTGTDRRFEVKGVIHGVTIVDDYAHHPTEISATLRAARERYGDQPVWAVFQPHTYSRTKLLSREFADALAVADQVVLLDVYAAREQHGGGISADDIALRLPRAPLRAPGPREAADLLVAAMVSGQLTGGSVVLLLGAGDIWQAGTRLLGDLAR